MFFGRYDYTIDAKGRLNFPAKFRDAMGESFVVLEWVDSCLFALPMEEVQRLADKLESDELMDSWAISGDLFSTACEVVPDKQGRILLPAELRAYAGLEKDVTIIGNRNHAEIWHDGRRGRSQCHGCRIGKFFQQRARTRRCSRWDDLCLRRPEQLYQEDQSRRNGRALQRACRQNADRAR